MEFDFIIALIALAIGWGVTILLKVIIETIKNKQFDFYYLVTDGGFPSSHSAFVASLTTVVFYYEGLSLIFLVTLCFSLLIIRDSLGIRKEVGKHKIILEKLNNTKLKLRREGHSWIEVSAGIIAGVGITLLVLILL
jgi:acid phosphatase family membrane protein YuiD